jgi:hypothetical protein
MLFDFVGSFFSGRAEEIFGVPYDVNPADPYAASVPTDLTIRAIVGGIASSLIRPAFEYLKAKGKSRRLLDPDAIARHAADGVKQGHLALTEAIRSSAAAANGMLGRLEEAFQPSLQGRIPVDLIGLRVEAECLQFPDPTDPALADVHRAGVKRRPERFAITLRVALAGSVIAHKTIEGIEAPEFQSDGAFIDLDTVLFDGVVQSGESLTVEVVTGEAGVGPVDTERVRFTDTIEGHPSNWLGPHAPSRSQTWRLWYKIEKTDANHRRSTRGSQKGRRSSVDSGRK